MKAAATWAILLLAIVAMPRETAAQSGQGLPIAAFFGTYEGSGFAENRESLYFGTTVRDLDVVIAPSGEGFFVKWTTVIRAGGDPARPDVKRKSEQVRFLPTAQPGIFRGEGSGDLLAGEPYIWASAAGNTLTVSIVTIDERGSYEVQRYARTVTGNGMDLVFTRVRDGDQVREARAKLVKIAN